MPDLSALLCAGSLLVLWLFPSETASETQHVI